jgi:hypothetical protein
MAAPDTRAIVDAITERSSVVAQTRTEPDSDWQPPELLVRVPEVEQLTFGDEGVWRLTFPLILVVASAWDDQAHIDMFDLLAPLKAELQADQTLGGTCRASWVRNVRPDDQIRDRQMTEWFGARLDLEVHT